MLTDILALEALSRDLVRRRLDEAAHDHLADQLKLPHRPHAPLLSVPRLQRQAHLPHRQVSLLQRQRLSVARQYAASLLRQIAVRVDPCTAYDHTVSIANSH